MDDSGYDSYAPDTTSGYSRENFYTRATDRRGHKDSYRYGPGRGEVVSVAPELHAMLSALREEYAEYKTPADITRDAYIHLFHLREEQRKNPTLDTARRLRKVHALATLEAWRAEVEMFEKTFSELETMFQSRDVKTRSEARKITEELLSDECNDEFKGRLGDLIRRYS